MTQRAEASGEGNEFGQVPMISCTAQRGGEMLLVIIVWLKMSPSLHFLSLEKKSFVFPASEKPKSNYYDAAAEEQPRSCCLLSVLTSESYGYAI